MDDDIPPRIEEPTAIPVRVSAREANIWRFVAGGMSSQEISKVLNIETRTVECHRANLNRRLGFRNTADLTRAAVAHGLIQILTPATKIEFS